MVKKRRRPSIDLQHPILDQIAQANTWQSPNRVISASYLRNSGTGNFVVSPHPDNISFGKLFRPRQQCQFDG